MTNLGRCQGWTRDSGFHGGHRCERQAMERVGDKNLCKAHANGKRKQVENDRLREERRKVADYRKGSAETACGAAQGHGYGATPYYDWRAGEYRDSVVISVIDLYAMLTKIEALETLIREGNGDGEDHK